MKGARSHRGRFKTAVLKALYETKEFGITPKTSATSVASRVEALLRHDRFLDATIPVSASHHRFNKLTNHIHRVPPYVYLAVQCTSRPY